MSEQKKLYVFPGIDDYLIEAKEALGGGYDQGATAEILQLRKALEIFADNTKQLEYTKGGFFIYRLTDEDMVTIAKALYPGKWIINHGGIMPWIKKQGESDG